MRVTVPRAAVPAAVLVSVVLPATAGATSPAINADPPPVVQTTLPANPLGGTIPLIYSVGIGESAPGSAFASFTFVVDRPGCVLEARIDGPSPGGQRLSGTVTSGAPVTLRGGAAQPGIFSVSISEGSLRQPECVGAPVGIAFGTQPGDRIIPVADARAATTPADPPSLVDRVAYAGSARRTTLTLTRTLGREGRTRRVRVTRAGTTWATGTLRGRTLRLTTTKGRSRPLGAFTLRADRGVTGSSAIASTALTITR